jgi:hypothetical protein
MSESLRQWGPTQSCMLSSTITVVPGAHSFSMYAFI